MIKLFEGIKWGLFALLIAGIVLAHRGGTISKTPFDTMSKAVTEASDLSEQLEGDRQMIRRLYRLDPEEYEGVTLYYPATNMGAEELLLVQLKDAEQEAAVLEAIDRRIATQKDSFEGYGIEQMEMLERSVCESQGNYVLFCVAKDPEPVRSVFEQNLDEGGAA